MIKTIKSSELKGVGIITSYQDSYNNILKNPYDNFSKVNELLIPEKIFLMENITELKTAHEIILFNIKDKTGVKKIHPDVIDIVLRKSFNGNPLFMIEIVNNLINRKCM